MKEEEKGTGAGIEIEPQAEHETRAPLSQEGEQREEGKPQVEPSIEAKEPTPGKIPLQPSVIRLAFRMPGELLAFRTGFDGWRLSEETLQDIVEVYQTLGIETAPWIQALILPITAYGERFVEFTMWRKAKSEKIAGALEKERGKAPGTTLEKAKEEVKSE